MIPKNHVFFILGVLLFGLQMRLWFGDGSIMQLLDLKKEVQHERDLVDQLEKRNHALHAEVQDLKERLDAIEERARIDLGMIKKHETFFFSSQEGSAS